MLSRAQESIFSVKVDKDTMGIDEILQIEFNMENIEGQFNLPPFEGFVILGGPNTMSSMNIINGQKTQKKSYSFLLKPRSEGQIIIEAATINNGDYTFKTDEIKIVVLDKTSGKNSHKIEKSYPVENQKNINRQNKRPIRRI